MTESRPESRPESKPESRSESRPDQSNPHRHDGAHDSAVEAADLSPRKVLAGVVALLVVFAVLAAVGILGRLHSQKVLASTTTADAPPTVIALPAKPGAPMDNFVLPGNVTAWTDSPIYARTSGYLTRWYYDIGAHVGKGALLATISSPEVDQQLAQARADLATAQANAGNARIQAQRYSTLVKSHAVSTQDADTYASQAAATAAAARSAQANVDRLRELQSFEKVYAPFSGVVTARNVDTGQLIDAGVNKELFHMQALETLRVYTNVPQLYADTAKRGLKLDLSFPEHPGKTFTGTLVRTANAIDPASRTLLVEIDVNNRNGELLPGSLAQVHFKATAAQATYIVPVAALIFRRQGMQLATLGPGNKAHLVSVSIGQDDGATVQIVSGLKATDKVIQDPPDSLIEGELVEPESPSQTAEGGY
ncbi:MAG TPA: efflux RND transporter periplasmic adaptor subunit [Terracidiphilus sp.]|nr:efflux RND transporter periplasmic adaptor subunit [Terracidiphilus sp.]